MAVFLLALSPGSCVEDAGPDAVLAIRDSAGIRIVEYPGLPALSAALALSPTPLYRHGAHAGEYPFVYPGSGVLLSDGSAAIADGGSGEIVLLGPDGSFRAVLATSGPGPGEVGDVRRLLLLGRDTVLVDDPGRGRLLLLGGGAPVRTVDVREHDGRLGIEGVDSTGFVLASSSRSRSGVNTPWQPGYMTRLDPVTGAVDTIAPYDWVPPGSPSADRGNPFKPRGHVTVAGGFFVHGRSDTPELVWRRPDGAVRQIVRWLPERSWPTHEYWQRYEVYVRAEVVRIHADLEPSGIEEAVDLNLARLEHVPDEPLPLYRQLFGDREGRVWIGEYTMTWDIPRHTVLSPEGDALGVVEVPEGFRLLDAAGGRVLGVLPDALDVRTIVVYELRRRSEESGGESK
ncbi:hypothetical protein [Candidatus Palauibacter sp.]|uniref:hypothetical protein n=1 Tax=Candidatus Palauibacter sp. TaxID=3101350 RepID=UPI003B020C6F